MEEEKLSKEELIKIILDSLEVDLKDKDIMELIRSNKISENINNKHNNRKTKGDIMADKLAAFAGSWKFIISFGVILILWVVVNVLLYGKSFDPYPFILLNLVLSCTAAIQAPILMMSQNRQEAKDRIRSENDYKVNLKSEILTEDLHERLMTIFNKQEEILNRLDSLEKAYKGDEKYGK